MATKRNGRYFAGVLKVPGEPTQLLDELPDVRDDHRFAPMDCKYCYTDEVQPVSSYEDVIEPVVQALCPDCGAGLTSTVKVGA